MSAHRLSIRFASGAQKDIRNILLFTEKRWGEQQREVYRAELDAAYMTIREKPAIGRARDDLLEGARGFVVRQHTILYTAGADAITVLRVVHVRKDFSNVLKP